MLQKSEIQNINSDINPMYKRFLSFYCHLNLCFKLNFYEILKYHVIIIFDISTLGNHRRSRRQGQKRKRFKENLSLRYCK